MPTLDEADAIQEFGRRLSPFLTTPTLPGHAVFDAFIEFCRDVRIVHAGDQLILEWGTMQPHVLNGFTDIRGQSPQWEDSRYQWIGLTRQIMSGSGDDDAALSAFVYFGPETGEEPSSCIEFEGLDALDASVERFLKKKYVTRLLGEMPSKVTAFVSEIG
ncbi:MAG: hypothetical protein AB7V46_24795 [Thermomicrobiales bacterium]